MTILSLNLLGSPNIGVYALTTNTHTLVPPTTATNGVKKCRDCLKGEVVATTIGGTRLIGVLTAANSHGIILPYLAFDEEVKTIRSVFDANVERVKSISNAFGNLILVNDHGGIAGPDLMREKSAIQKIEDVLSVEIVEGEIVGLPYVGSLAATTNTATLAHPMITDEEQKLLESVLKVHVDVGTINGGSPFVSSGILVNDYGAVIGNHTTGPEVFIISNLFNG